MSSALVLTRSDVAALLDLPACIRAVAEGLHLHAEGRSLAMVAGPTLKTTKDMPVVEPDSFEALDLVPFHISPHYLDPEPASRHMGETQEERILQFLEENDGRVVGLREGSMLRLSNGETTVLGELPVRLFQRGTAPAECAPGPLRWPS